MFLSGSPLGARGGISLCEDERKEQAGSEKDAGKCS